MRIGILCLMSVITPAMAAAHDTWVEVNSPVVRLGDVVHIDLKLGNHGNGHRDFKLASKITLAPCQLSVVDPDGRPADLKSGIADAGYAPKEGYWTNRFVTKTEGLHVVSHTLDTLHGTTRAIKSGKTYFIASKKIDELSSHETGFDKPLGHPLELVPVMNTVANTGPGLPIRVKLYYQSKPLAGARVSFIPRGAVLAEGFDKDFERTTDVEGVAEFIPKEGNVVLVVVHHSAPEQKGEGFDKTHYAATLTVAVPHIEFQKAKKQ